MARYGEVPTDNPILANIKAKREGLYEFRLYPQLWSCPDLASYYRGRKWEEVPFTSPPPALWHPPVYTCSLLAPIAEA